MDRKEYQRFSNDLWDGFEVLSKHTNNEIQFCKDLVKFMKKRKDIEEEYAKSLEKLAKKAEYVNPHGSVATAWQAILNETAQTAAYHNSVVAQVNEKVIESVQTLVKELETQRKQMVTEGTNLNTEYAASIDTLKKAKSSYEKACKEAEIAKLTYDKAKADPLTKPKELPKFEKEMAKKHSDATLKDDVYKKQVEDTNNFMELYYTEKMPKVLNDFEHFETQRIQYMKAHMKKYVKIRQELPPLLTKEADNLGQTVERVNHDADIDLFVNQNKTHQEIPDAFDYEPYQQGNQVAKVKPADKIKRFIRANAVQKTKSEQNLTPNSSTAPPPSSPTPKPKTAIFGVPLSEVMEKQKDKFPDTEIPHILEALVDAVFAMDGLKTEGIFRIPASGPELNLLKDKIDHGGYEIVSNCVQAFTPCAMIKMWLRELPDPLVPNNYYDAATETPEKAVEILEQLPSVNQKIIVYLVNFLQELAKPEVVDQTKMSADNLAMCLAPSFLRCPYQDYNRVLASTDKQKAFVLQLMDKIPQRTTFWRSNGLNSSNASVSTSTSVETVDGPPPIPEFD